MMTAEDRPLVAWGDTRWDVLLMRLEAKRVIPVIGPDLVRILPGDEDLLRWNRPAGSTMTMESYLTLRLADEWTAMYSDPPVAPADLPSEPRFNDFVCLYLDRKGPREGVDQFYGMVTSLCAKTRILTDPGEPIPAGAIRLPQSLLQLAEITDFSLFLTTTGDPLLETALRKARPGSGPVQPSPAFTNETPLDLPQEHLTASAPIVYHLFGKFDVDARSFVLTEDDLLDFVVSIQARGQHLGRLNSVLKANQLLLLGGGFPDWLARFFMRTAKPSLLNAEDIFADDVAATDRSFRRFLQRFSPKTTILPGGGETFIGELHHRWQARRGSTSAVETSAPQLAAVMPPRVAFISYASANRPFAKQLLSKLRAAGVEVWFDQEQLEAGDNWDLKIRLNIQRCTLLLPLVSRDTESRLEGYFRREWNAAAVRSESFASSVPFILPLLLNHDLPPEQISHVPESFRVPQWATCSQSGEIPDAYIERVKLAYEFWLSQS